MKHLKRGMKLRYNLPCLSFYIWRKMRPLQPLPLSRPGELKYHSNYTFLTLKALAEGKQLSNQPTKDPLWRHLMIIYCHVNFMQVISTLDPTFFIWRREIKGEKVSSYKYEGPSLHLFLIHFFTMLISDTL